ncbi:MarR family winged helix-turn-helix transcriptional regulator [Agrilactobacillus yilanensis]|uniref:MarR family winged helix-turn-helix transcriptional regulator n=1 Tax=Agrilactobacillus yilanensis TaxID=2485997 RepID=A0ABW4J5F6_9LACO|nr:MarR family transcriptional regulator [Agrilactobacillus yilanensis]
MLSYLSKYIAGIYRQSKIDINQQFQSLGLKATEGDLLLFLHDNPGLSQKKVAVLMVLDPSLIGRDIQHLIKLDYVVRRPSETDSRVNLVYLTPLGEQLVQNLRQILTQWWTTLFAETATADQTETGVQLEQLYDTIIRRNL